MNLQKLFTMQEALDHYIQTNKQVTEDVFTKKGLALLVELAELANETRCFKFWSEKGPSERECYFRRVCRFYSFSVISWK